ncbi:ABC transporter permease [Moheibacter sediminis]|uniref:Putative ABC transport system permease protein n=1 Tax=Moheibacter sediminis TaxID=1434700 RepID=A0A1W1ZCA5_9FLAO|nr:ABC transporter permease [Moheibacter sediminis]SMC46060.1 putative ABC transport system permease protein [Moheibacter sediminis]
MLQNWIKIAFRNFAKNKLAAFINIFGLTIGMVGVILTILYWKDELSYNQWNPQKENVYQVVHDMGSGDFWSSGTIPQGPKMKEIFPEVEDYLYINWMGSALVQSGKKSAYLDGLLPATVNFFEFFPFKFIEGSSKDILNNQQNIAISKKWATQLFENQSALGKILKIKDKEYIVRGVFDNEAASSELPEAVIALNWDELWRDYSTAWGNYQYKLYVKLQPESYSPDLMKKINHEIFYVNQVLPNSKEGGVTPEQYIEKFGETKMIFDKLSEMRLFSLGDGGTMGKGNVSLLYIMTALSIVILLLSCVNFINLSTANAMKRAKEVGVRKALGAQRKNVIFQFMFESFILCVFAFVLALALSEIILPYYNDYLNKSLKLEFGSMLGYLSLVLGFVILISGLFPALYLSKFQPLEVLKGNFSRSKSGVWVRNALMGFQFFISAFFFIGGLIVYLQVNYMMTRDLGFNADQTIVVYFNNYTDTLKYNKYELIKQSFKNIDGIEEISSGMRVPGYISSNSSNLEYLGKSVQTTNSAMDYNYLDLLKVKLVKGRKLSPEISSDTLQNILANEKLVKELGLKEPLGAEVQSGMNNQKFKIVGVVQDYFVEGFQNEIRPTIFYHWKLVSWQKYNLQAVLFKINPEKTESTLEEIEKRWKTQIEPGYPFQYKFVDQQFARTYQQYQNQKIIFFILTITVITIALLGLFGLVSFIIEQRMREISIRKTLGASQRNIVFMFSKKYIIIAAISILCSIPITFYLMQKWLENFVFRIDMPLWPYVMGLIVLLCLALFVVSIRAFKATRSNSVKYLKYE